MPAPRPVPPVALAAVLAVAVQLWGLYRAGGPPDPTPVPGLDKVAHAVVFAVPLWLVLRAAAAWTGRRPAPRTVGVVVAVFAGHAVLSEVLQHLLYTWRTGDPYDVLADLLGVAAGLVLARRFDGVRSPGPAAAARGTR